MQCSPQELKEKLLRHLDNEYNVVDLQGVYDIMSILERYPVTKEHLEQTRIGKYVNEMRRRTDNRNLARRAKDLVRKWQQLVASQSTTLPTPASTASMPPSSSEIKRVFSSGSLVDSPNSVRTLPNRPQNGSYVRLPVAEAVSSDKRLPTPEVVESWSSRGKGGSLVERSLVKSQPPMPVTTASIQSLSRVATPSTFCRNANSPQMTTQSAKQPAAAATLTNSSQLLPMYSHYITNGTKSITGFDGGASSGRLKQSGSSDVLCASKHKYSNGMLKASSSSNLVCNGTWSVHCDNDFNITRTLSPDLQPVEAPLAKLKIKINRTSASGSTSSPVLPSKSVAAPIAAATPTTASRKAQKVATTAELIHRLHVNGELRLVASETLNRIATNQIEHEADDSKVSIVPDGAKPRPHKRRRIELLPDQLPPAMTDSDLLQVKAERVRNFVQMSSADVSPTTNDNDLLGLLGRLPSATSTAADMTQPREPETVPKSPELQLPSLTDFEIDWDSTAYTVPEVRPPPSESDVDRLLHEQWPSVNGQYDHRGDWTDWTQSYSAAGYDGSLIHILPYVDIDD